MKRIKKSERQGVTAVLDASKIVLLPNDNRHKFTLRWHPGNAAGTGIWVHKVDGSIVFKKGAAVDDASANATNGAANEADATATNSGIYLDASTPAYSEDGSGDLAFSGALTALATAANVKIVVEAH